MRDGKLDIYNQDSPWRILKYAFLNVYICAYMIPFSNNIMVIYTVHRQHRLVIKM